MKNLKAICLLFVFLVVLSCSKNDDSDSGEAVTPTFTATITGGSFGNYSSTLGFHSSNSSDGTLTIAITDANNHIIRIFLNATGGLSNGVVKQIGDVDSNGFATTVTIRDQDAQITYNSTSGSISISGNREHPDESGRRLISGNFTITASTNTGEEVMMTGNFTNIDY